MEAAKKYLANYIYPKRKLARKLFSPSFVGGSKGSVIFILALFILGIFVPTKFADAQLFSIADFAGGALLSILSFLLSFVVVAAAFLAGLAGSFMDWVLNWEMFYTKCTEIIDAEDCFIDIAWKTMRDLVNAFLIIALVIIALFTIVGSRGYGAKNAFIPLVLVALLVNFSRVIVGLVIDSSNVVMGVFVQAMPSFSDISTLIDATGIDVGGGFTLQTDLALSNLLQIVVTIIFFLGLAFILTLYAIIFAARFVILWLLTIFSPIAIAAYIFPSTKKLFNFWRDQLVQWSIIGIPILFFLWVALLFITQLDKMKPPPGAGGGEAFFLAIIPNLFALLFLFIAFLVGMQTGAMGSKMIISQGKKFGAATGKFTGKWGTKLGWRMGRRAARKVSPEAGRKMAAAFERAKRTKLGQRIERGIGRIPSQWRPGHAKREWDKNSQQQIRAANLTGQKSRYGRPIKSTTPWESLTPQQQKMVKEAARSQALNTAGKVLGKPAGWAKNAAKLTWNQLLPDEQEAIRQVVFLEKIRKAQKAKAASALKDLEEKDYSLEELSRTILGATDPSVRLAAQVLLAQKMSTEDFDKKFDRNERIKITKEAVRLNIGKELFAAQPQLIKEAFPGVDNSAKRAKMQNKALSEFSKKMKEAYDDMEHLEDEQIKMLIEKGNNVQKVAGARRLADRKKFDKQIADPEQQKLINVARKYNQEYQILKRYPHKARDKKEMQKVKDRMVANDWEFLHPDTIDPDKNKEAFKFIIKNIPPEGAARLTRSRSLREKLEDVIDKHPELHNFLTTENKPLNTYMDKKRNSEFGISNWPKAPTGGGPTTTP